MVPVPQTLSKLSWKAAAILFRNSPSYSAEELDQFRHCQRLAYQCAIDIGRELQEGWTELQTANLMDTYLRDCGVKTFFHRSFAWFGDRTRFQGFANYLHFLPSKQRLRSGDVIILDTAPVLNGFTADIGYTLSLEPHRELEQAQQKLLELRKQIPNLFQAGIKTREIWHRIDRDLKADGYDNIHSMYPFSVLGHRVRRISASSFPGLVRPFTWQSYWALFSHGLLPELLGPEHEGSAEGLWAIEPHLGGSGFGAKFEEILIVKNGNAQWLDDNVPHITGPTRSHASEETSSP